MSTRHLARAPPSRSLTVSVLVILLTLQALTLPLASTDATADGTHRSGETLVVDGTYTVKGTESWEEVQVWTDGRLIIEAESTLFAGSVSLNGVLDIRGGTLILGGSFDRGPRTLHGGCRELSMSPGSAISVIGGGGNGTIEGSQGEAASIDITASSRIRIVGSLIWVTGGIGHSPGRPYTDGDLEGVVSAGGSASVHFAVRSTGTALEITDSRIDVIGGDGGDAPNGTAPHRGTGGRGGGFSEGGDVTGDVARGGDGSVDLEASTIDLDGTSIHVSGGDGGDGGDGGPVGPGTTAGGGGGGYSGGPGADAGALHATPGGAVSSRVGAGGNAIMTVDGMDCSQVGTDIQVHGGKGGKAGNGGDSSGDGGGGGGGYSGGGGGSSPYANGSDGGRIGQAVGRGGYASVRYDLSGQLRNEDSQVQASGGSGGDAGDGGSVVRPSLPLPMGGAGGGGYSGGGGGATGSMVDNLTLDRGTDGGYGGPIYDGSGSGGDVNVRLVAEDALLMGGGISVTGGDGGTGGDPGRNLWIGHIKNEMAGGGGGSYSGGGGAGSNGQMGSGGSGGVSLGAHNTVGNGGDASLLIEPETATVLLWNQFISNRGSGGRCLASPECGSLSGKGEGRLTRSGMREVYIPRSRGVPLLPLNGTVDSRLPKFTWAPIHPSTDGGAVTGYELVVDDDPDFSSPEWTAIVPNEYYQAFSVPNFTSYWRVAPRYANPPNPRGLWSGSRIFEYVNLPPVIGDIPLMTVPLETVTTIDLSPFIDDPDDVDGNLTLDCDDPAKVRTSELNISLYFGVETALHIIRFTATDGLSRVYGEFFVQALSFKHPPNIRGLEGIRPPIDLTIEEGTSEWYNILVHDVDSDEFTYRTTGWSGAVGHENGTLQVVADKGEVGTFKAILTVDDELGQTAEMEIKVVVTNVNDPPSVPVVTSPGNGSTYSEGQMVRFTVTVDDIDVRFGQRLNVSFISNASGIIKTIQTDGVASFSYSGLPVGEHRISVVATDGRYSSNSWFVLTVEGPPEPSNVEVPQTESVDPTYYLMAAVALFAVAYVVGWWHSRREGPTE